MSKQNERSPLSIVLGAAIVTSLGATGIANANTGDNLFSSQELSSGYLTAGGHGDAKKEGEEGGCGGDKGEEGGCGGDKGKEGGCGGDKDHKGEKGEGGCGEGKCGGNGA